MANIRITPNDLTSATSHPPFVVTQSHIYAGTCFGFYAFNNVLSGAGYQWLAPSGGGAGNERWIKIDLGENNQYIVKEQRIYPVSTYTNYSPFEFVLKGSNNDSSWTSLDTRTGQSSWTAGSPNIYTFLNNQVFRYIMLVCTTVCQNIDAIGLDEWELWGELLAWPHFSKRNGSAISTVNKINGITKANFGKVNGISVNA